MTWDKPKIYQAKLFICDNCGEPNLEPFVTCSECSEQGTIHTYTGILQRWPDATTIEEELDKLNLTYF